MMKNLVMISLSMGLHSLVIADAQAAPPPLEDGVKVLRNLEYSRPEGRPLLLDLYLPPAGQGRPAVVMWIHGGGWKNGSKEPCRASWLAAKGYAVASINYRLLPNQWPSQMEDCRAAVRWLRINASTHGFDASRVAAWGGSAGAHLAALMGTLDAPEEERIQAVIDWYGPTDLLTMPSNVATKDRSREELAQTNGAQLLGGIVADLPAKAKSASALAQVNAGDAPFLIMHGEADTMVPLDQSQRLHAALRGAGVDSTLHVVADAGHGGKAFDTPEVRAIIVDFLAKHLLPANP